MSLYESLNRLRGETSVKRAIQIAWAGGHHLLILGDAQMGKTTLLRAIHETHPMTYPLSLSDNYRPMLRTNSGVVLIDDFPLQTSSKRLSALTVLGTAAPQLIITSRYCRCGANRSLTQLCSCRGVSNTYYRELTKDLCSRNIMVAQLGENIESPLDGYWSLTLRERAVAVPVSEEAIGYLEVLSHDYSLARLNLIGSIGQTLAKIQDRAEVLYDDIKEALYYTPKLSYQFIPN